MTSGAAGREGGWVAVHRRLRSSELYRSLTAEQRSVFVTLLLLANWADRPAFLGRTWVTILRGELAHSLVTIAADAAVSVKVVRTTITKLMADDSPAGGRGPFLGERYTGTDKGTGYRILRVLRYDEYQSQAADEGTPMGMPGARQGHTTGTAGAPREQVEQEEQAQQAASRPASAPWEAFRDLLAYRMAVPRDWIRLSRPEEAAATREQLNAEVERLGLARAVEVAAAAAARSKNKPRYLRYFVGALQDASSQHPRMGGRKAPVPPCGATSRAGRWPRPCAPRKAPPRPWPRSPGDRSEQPHAGWMRSLCQAGQGAGRSGFLACLGSLAPVEAKLGGAKMVNSAISRYSDCMAPGVTHSDHPSPQRLPVLIRLEPGDRQALRREALARVERRRGQPGRCVAVIQGTPPRLAVRAARPVTAPVPPGTAAASTGTARESRTTAKQAAAVALLAAGKSYDDVIAEIRVSKRTLVRWAAEPAFSSQIRAARGRILDDIVGVLAGEASSSVRILAQLRDGAESEQVRLGACRALLEHFQKGREATDLEVRLGALESRHRLTQLISPRLAALKSTTAGALP